MAKRNNIFNENFTILFPNAGKAEKVTDLNLRNFR